jgi:carbon-monoxide dehydrogenase large subunit
MKFVGRSVERLEDLPLVTGRGRFAATISFPRQLHMRIVRSAHAHGRIVSIDTSEALAAPGCVAVWTFTEVAQVPPIEFRPTRVQGLEPYRQRLLASDHVRYVGEPVAAVFAEDAYLAEDAADLVAVEVEPLPAVLSADDPAAVEPAVIRKEFGDLEEAFRRAHAVVALDLSIGRHSGVPMECRGAIARHDSARDVLELHAATKRPHANRDLIARMLQRSPASVQLFEGNIGGGFGVRGELYPEDLLVCVAALRLGRPVKWIEDRRENLLACNHSRQQRHQVRAAIDREGRILGLEDRFFHDQGAYVRTHGARVADMTAGMLPSVYRVPAFRVAGHYRLTNKTPAATYRAPGRFESTFVIERLMDAIARKVGIDGVEVRRRNLIGKSEMPYTRAMEVLETEQVLDSGDYAGLLDKALAAAGWTQLQAEVQRRRQNGEAVGAGLAMYLEKSGLGPVDAVKIRVDPDGSVEVITGAASVGQGVETVMAQICADALGVDYRSVRVIHGRTDRIEKGYGSHASRTTVMTGEAGRIAGTHLRAMIIGIAEGMFDLPAEILDIVDGKVVRTDVKAPPLIALGELARNNELAAQGDFRCEHMTYPYGVHAAVVKVDRDTGGVRVERYLVAYDIWRAVNPMLVEGQIHGGFAQGLGGALYEEFLYDAEGQPLSVTFADYLLPTMSEVPPLQVLITEDAPSPLNGLGVKGAGEAGVTAVGAAIASAIDDAIGIPGAVTQLPVTPQRLRTILGGAQT